MENLSLKNENVTIPLLIFGVLVATSFMPVIHIVVMYTNGGIVGIITDFFTETGDTDFRIYMVLNGVFLLLALIAFYQSKSTLSKVLWCLVATIFLFPLVAFSIDGFTSQDPYYLLFLITSLLSGLVLTLVGILKSQRQKYKHAV